MTALLPISPPVARALRVSVIERDERPVPRLLMTYERHVDVHELRATKHAIAALVEAATPVGARWDVLAVEGGDRWPWCGVELALDSGTFALALEGRAVLERVRSGLGGGA